MDRRHIGCLALPCALGLLSACPAKDDPVAEDSSSGSEESGGEESSSSGESEVTEGACDDVLPPKHLSPEDDDEECNVDGEHGPCRIDREHMGTRFCDLENPDGWGPCLAEYECVPGDYVVCWVCHEEFGTGVAYCDYTGGIPHYDDEICSTPLVLRLGDRPVEFTASTAHFAMTAEDRCPATDWPSAATPWLALDRDHNGSIDGGHELFGSGTPRGPTYASDGFLALADLDSDGDRRITPADARWPELLAWSDHDGDRRSTAWELTPLASLGLTAIDLNYTRTGSQCDARANCEIERASVSFIGNDGRPATGEVIDVRLACQ